MFAQPLRKVPARMKMRLNDNSVRLRCRRSEVAEFGSMGRVESVTLFPGGREFRVILVAGEVDGPEVTFEGDRLTITLPAATGAGWASGDAVGIYGQDGPLEILVEKDFRRTSLPSPDDADRYPNPRAIR